MTNVKNVLIVFAHMEKESFNGALLEAAKSSLEAAGHSVVVSDLYAMKFNPVIGKHDITDARTDGPFNYLAEVASAVASGHVAPDIVEEQQKVAAADLVIFQFPIQWYSMPAILKGWLERVMAPGFAYNPAKGELFDRAGMKGKKALCSFTTGSAVGSYDDTSINGSIDVHTFPFLMTLRFLGFDVLRPQASFGVKSTSEDDRAKMLQSYRDRLGTVFDEEPMTCFSLREFVPLDGDPSKGMVLNEAAATSGKQTVGQNRGWKSLIIHP